MVLTETQTQELLNNALELARENQGDEWVEEYIFKTIKPYHLESQLYKPDELLINRVEDYKRWVVSKKGECPGNLMEEIALLAFKCVKGYDSIKSYQSFSAQHDLVISGTDKYWTTFIRYLRPDWNCRTIIIEAKNYNKKISDKIFSRLCVILFNLFEQSANLGIFFTRFGASGFPDENRKKKKIRQRTLRDCKATQVIFHAKTKKCVVVFSHNDILKLVEPGALPKLLEAKIREVEEVTGLPLEFNEEWKEADLPKHLKKYY